MPTKNTRKNAKATSDSADARVESPAEFIATYLENGLRNEIGVDVQVKRIRVDLETSNGQVCVDWGASVFTNTTYVGKLQRT